MKKLLLVANVSKEHIRKFHIPLIMLFKERGWQVDVACRLDVPVPESDNAFDLPCDRDPFHSDIVGSVRVLKEILPKNNYDVVLCNTIVGSLIARLAASAFRKNGLKVIYLNHGLHFFPGASLSRWLMGYPMEKIMASRTDMMITINVTDCDTAKKYLKIPVIEKCHGMGVDLSHFRNCVLTDEARNTLRKGLGVSAGDFVLTYVAEINDNKNQKMLVDALELANRTIPNAKLMLIGPEHDDGVLRCYIESKEMQDRVLFLGWRNDIPELLHMSNLYVASSKSEGMGLNLIEAMACNLPVIASKNRGHSEIVNHEQNGFLVKQNDSRQMADYIIKLFESAELKKAVTEQAQRDISKYETKAAIDEIYEIIASCVRW